MTITEELREAQENLTSRENQLAETLAIVKQLQEDKVTSEMKAAEIEEQKEGL